MRTDLSELREVIKEQSVKESVLIVIAPTQSSVNCKQLQQLPIKSRMSADKDLSNSKISPEYVQAECENDKTAQNIIHLEKTKIPQ